MRWLLSSLLVLAVADAPYRIDPSFGKLPDGLKWGLTAGMAIDADDHVYAFTRAEPPLIVLDKHGTVLRTWGAQMFGSPHGIRVDRFGDLWMTDWRTRDGKGQQVFNTTATCTSS